MMKEKFIKKFMRMAKLVGEDQNPCLSRSIGVVVVDPKSNKVLATGYNGPPRDTPHCDDPEYLRDIVWPQLTEEEKAFARGKYRFGVTRGEGAEPESECDLFVKNFEHCGQCPRKLVGAESGQRLELCSCAHGEANAIVNATKDLYEGSTLLCWCGIPCFECTKLIINAGVKTVYCFDWGKDYSHGSRWLFKKAGVEVIEKSAEYYLNDE